MTKKTTEFEQFIIWFSALEEIPLQTRHDFLAHITEVGYVDEKAEKFIVDTLEKLEKKSQKRQTEWNKYKTLVTNANLIEKNKKTSLRHKIAKEITTWMNEKVDNFKTMFRAKEASIMHREESAEDLENMAQIARLKAAL